MQLRPPTRPPLPSRARSAALAGTALDPLVRATTCRTLTYAGEAWGSTSIGILRCSTGGAAKRLDGIDVFHDFEWLDEFPDERTPFVNGQCLAKRVRDHCPQGKTPALLLTVRDDVDEGALDAGAYYVVVVNLTRYLATEQAASTV